MSQPNEGVQQVVIRKLNEASKLVLEAYSLATKTNAMAQDLPVFQEMLKEQKKLGELMQQVSKVRGL